MQPLNIFVSENIAQEDWLQNQTLHYFLMPLKHCSAVAVSSEGCITVTLQTMSMPLLVFLISSSMGISAPHIFRLEKYYNSTHDPVIQNYWNPSLQEASGDGTLSSSYNWAISLTFLYILQK